MKPMLFVPIAALLAALLPAQGTKKSQEELTKQRAEKLAKDNIDIARF